MFWWTTLIASYTYSENAISHQMPMIKYVPKHTLSHGSRKWKMFARSSRTKLKNPCIKHILAMYVWENHIRNAAITTYICLPGWAKYPSIGFIGKLTFMDIKLNNWMVNLNFKGQAASAFKKCFSKTKKGLSIQSLSMQQIMKNRAWVERNIDTLTRSLFLFGRKN